jgi:predicted DNA-binding protein with PD1-like motif
MKAKLVHRADQRTWVLVFETGDEAVSTLQRFAKEQGLRGSHFNAIGAFSEARLGYFDWEARHYRPIPIREQVEVLSLAGDIAEGTDGTVVHAHAVLGRADGSACGGHLLEGKVRPTLELVLTESPHHLVRVHDPQSGLPLIDLSRSGA